MQRKIAVALTNSSEFFEQSSKLNCAKSTLENFSEYLDISYMVNVKFLLKLNCKSSKIHIWMLKYILTLPIYHSKFYNIFIKEISLKIILNEVLVICKEILSTL